jgi:hypothetical protein
MYHTIEFISDWVLDVAISPRQPLERLQICKGAKFIVQLKPLVVETPNGFVEVADLFFDDGVTSYSVPFALFRFVD